MGRGDADRVAPTLREDPLPSTSPPGSSLLQRTEPLITPFAQLITRLVFGQAFLLAGLTKLNSLEQTTQQFTDLGIPLPHLQAPLIAGLEFLGGILLVVGLGTRIVSLLLAATMVVAVATAHTAELLDGLTMTRSFATVPPLPYLVAVAWLLAQGAGTISADHLLSRRRSAS